MKIENLIGNKLIDENLEIELNLVGEKVGD